MGRARPVLTVPDPAVAPAFEPGTRLRRRKPRIYLEWKALRRWGRLPPWEEDPPGYLLRVLREESGLSQAALAERLGCSQQAIAQAERADSNPTIRFLREWAQALSADVELCLRPPFERPQALRTSGKRIDARKKRRA